MESTNFVIKIFRSIKYSLIINRNEPQIKHKCDVFGNQYWEVHDYKTNKFYSFGSDRDVRAWLEDRYRRI